MMARQLIDIGARYASSGEIEAGRQTAFIRYGRHLWELGETELITFDDGGAARRFRVRALLVIRAELRDLPLRVCIQSGSADHADLRVKLERQEMLSSARRPDDPGKSPVRVLLSSRVTALTFQLMCD